MTIKTVHVVKFDKGYYADKQPGYGWSYTNDLLLAKQYKTAKLAKERAEWGLRLIANACATADIEVYEVITTVKRVK